MRPFPLPIEAAQAMDDVFRLQACGDEHELLSKIAAVDIVFEQGVDVPGLESED